MGRPRQAIPGLARAVFGRGPRVAHRPYPLAPDSFVPNGALAGLRPRRVLRRLVIGLWPRVLAQIVRSFYADRLGSVALLMCAVILTYGGGAAMFWFHAIYLGEGGPAISPWLHWALDSTAGFIGLTPPISIILPVAAWVTAPASGSINPAGSRRPIRFAVIGGVLLALVAAPGPVLHDTFLGRGTWLADQITEWWGGHEYHEWTGTPQEASIPVKIGQQIAAGALIYVCLMWIAVCLLRWLAPAPPQHSRVNARVGRPAEASRYRLGPTSAGPRRHTGGWST